MSSDRPKVGPSPGHHLMDFANMLKAFIGVNYLGIAFAFRQSGIALGVVGLVTIATVTAHCCNLIVKCKYCVIQMILEDKHLFQNKNSDGAKYFEMQNKDEDSITSSDSDVSSSEEEEYYQKSIQNNLLRNLNYGDIGRLCMGKAGLTLVNSAVMITQFGFCVAYYIFIGNTLHSMFPLYNCSMSGDNSTMHGALQQCFEVKHLNSLNAVHVDMGEMTETAPGILNNRRDIPDSVTTASTDVNSFITFLESENVSTVYALSNLSSTPTSFYNMSRTAVPSRTVDDISKTTTEPPLSISSIISSPGVTFPDTVLNTSSTAVSQTYTSDTSSKEDHPKISMPIHTIPSTDNTTWNVTTSAPSTEDLDDVAVTAFYDSNFTTASSNSSWGNAVHWILTRGKHVPDVKLLVLLPATVFIPTTLIRGLRRMGFISFIANTAIFAGCIEVLLFLVSGFAASNTFLWANWTDFPIFFGIVTSAFEGIGTILPIESSMEGNRHNFTKFLNGAVAIVATVLALFGVLGYIRFGHGIEQMINANIPSSNWLGIAVNACLCVGVLLTFPLVIYPVVEMSEIHLFGEGRLCGPRSKKSNTVDHESLLPRKGGASLLPVAEKIPDSIPAWKRNILRIFIVLSAGGLAVLLSNYFAYISAFIGALGSTMLAYILPCFFHLKLCWSQLPLCVKVKDITIIIMGVCFGAAGIYAVLLEIFSGVHSQ